MQHGLYAVLPFAKHLHCFFKSTGQVQSMLCLWSYQIFSAVQCFESVNITSLAAENQSNVYTYVLLLVWGEWKLLMR